MKRPGNEGLLWPPVKKTLPDLTLVATLIGGARIEILIVTLSEASFSCVVVATNCSSSKPRSASCLDSLTIIVQLQYTPQTIL